MSYIYSQALVAEYSRANCSVIDASALWSGSPTRKPHLWHDKTTEHSRHSRFGMMCKPLTERHGAALLTWWRAGFRAKTYPLRGGGAGLDGQRSGMWHHMARIIGEVRPCFAFIENSPALVNRGLDRVLADLARLGFDARWTVLGASDVDAPHHRQRIWILANAIGQRCNSWRHHYQQDDRPEPGADGEHTKQVANTNGMRELQPQGHERHQRGWACNGGNEMANTDCERSHGCGCWTEKNWRSEFTHCGADVPHSHSHSPQGMVTESQPCGDKRPAGLHDRAAGFCPWPADPADAPESGLGRVAYGVAHRAQRIKAIGNGQVPRVAATAFNFLKSQL